MDQDRIAELREGYNRTDEIDAERLGATKLTLTADPSECKGYDVYLVTVPTPVDRLRRPDLGHVMSATRTVAGLIAKGSRALIVYESTVYPGVTESLWPRIGTCWGAQAWHRFRSRLFA